jgi:hypothetical protein
MMPKADVELTNQKFWLLMSSCCSSSQYHGFCGIQVSISSTFYVQIFHANLVSAAFSSYVLALGRNLYKKIHTFNVDEIDN